jgi:hypothetical protein
MVRNEEIEFIISLVSRGANVLIVGDSNIPTFDNTRDMTETPTSDRKVIELIDI